MQFFSHSATFDVVDLDRTRVASNPDHENPSFATPDRALVEAGNRIVRNHRKAQ